MTVLLIAAFHALPIILAGWAFRSVAAVWIAAAIMAVVAISGGNPSYTFIDLIAVAAGALFAHGKVPKPMT